MRMFIVCALLTSACAVPLTDSERLATYNRLAALNHYIVDAVVSGNKATNIKAMVITVANPRPNDILIRAVCEYVEDGAEFGSSNYIELKAGMKRNIMVRGLMRDGGKYSISCILHSKDVK